MNRLLIVFALLVLGAIGLGFYLGNLRIHSDSVDGATNITLTVDTRKTPGGESKVLENSPRNN